MSVDILTERRKWFRFFPAGSIEFVIITRVLALMLLMALAIVGGTQRPMVLVGLALVLWADYILVLWWAVEVAVDLEDVFQKPPVDNDVSRRRRIRVIIQAALPSIVAMVLVAPWPDVLKLASVGSGYRAGLTRVVLPLAGVLLVVFLVVGQRALQRVHLGPARWTFLMLIPVVHWFALHRLLTDIYVRLGRQGEAIDSAGQADEGAGLSVVLADVTWVLSVLPWVILLAVSLLGRGWPGTFPLSAAPVCGTLLAALFAIANLAAMEGVQRRLVFLIRKL